jgi:hypothetical protein
VLVVLDLQLEHLPSSWHVAQAFARLVDAQGRHNADLLRAARRQGNPLPPIYSPQANVRYRPEPNMGRFEEICSIVVLLARGVGDCDDLAAARIGELLEQGIKARSKIYWRQHSGGRVFHAELRRLDTDEVEDPSSLLGMRGMIR